jgi:transcriptional regulator with PAS, ATPase and Fis domain
MYEWPGNVRELEHVLELVHVLSDGYIITEKDLRIAILQDEQEISEDETTGVRCFGYMPLKDAKREVERQLVLKAYDEFNNTYKVAEVLNIDQSTVVKLLKKHRD